MDVESQATIDEAINRLAAKQMELLKTFQSILAQERLEWVEASVNERKALIDALMEFGKLAVVLIEFLERIMR